MKPLFLIMLAGLLQAPLRAIEFHVSPAGDDVHAGTRAAPLRTIQNAANRAQPGDVVTVHAGVYRERINPPRGGESDSKRIIYQAARGEKVEIKGSEIVKNWVKVQEGVWKATLPNAMFGSFNPYNDLIRGDWFDARGRAHHTGAVYLNGEWLIEATKLDEVLAPAGTPPPWLSQAAPQYLLNVGWLQPSADGKAAARIPATGCAAKQGARNAPNTEGGECLGWISEGDWARYERVEFAPHTNQLEIRAASPGDGGVIEIRSDTADGELLGTCAVDGTGDWQSWTTFKAKIKPVGGVKTLCLVFKKHRNSALNSQLWFAQVDASLTTIWAQFKDADPNKQLVEINVRQSVFYPEKVGMNYLTVRGFTMSQAATPWAPPTAEQIGLIGTHWSKGWIIENNTVSHSVCSGIALGKHGDEWDNTSANSAEGYVKTIERAVKNGWNKDSIGHHIVRNNHISHCEQTGVVGSLGAIYCQITGNTIHDIHTRRLFSGAEMAGIKLHGAIDTEISGNHIYRSCRGLWLDWMAQGTRVTRNLFHDNPDQDIFVEVNHGPFLIDNNIFLSPTTLLSVSQGGAYVHNLIAGGLNLNVFDDRSTPFHKPHSTEIAGMHNNPYGDDRYYNNIFVARANLTPYDAAPLPSRMKGNLFLKGAQPAKLETAPLVKPDRDPALKLVQKSDGFYLEMKWDATWNTGAICHLVTTEVLGKSSISGCSYENPDSSPLRIDTDYFGKPRNTAALTAGPFNTTAPASQSIKVW